MQWDSPQHQQQEQRRQRKHRQEVPSKETPVCAAPLHHAIVKPEGLELNTYSHPEKPLGQKRPEQTHSHSRTWRGGNRGENGHRFKKGGRGGVEGGELPRFYVLPPACREASPWPALHPHSSRMLQNRSPASRGEGRVEKEKEGESERRLKIAVKRLPGSFFFLVDIFQKLRHSGSLPWIPSH